ncbi:hypothetical protein [Pyrodictium occultum]|nr:hypothetical protein [Pyrodictium occultum]
MALLLAALIAGFAAVIAGFAYSLSGGASEAATGIIDESRSRRVEVE